MNKLKQISDTVSSYLTTLCFVDTRISQIYSWKSKIRLNFSPHKNGVENLVTLSLQEQNQRDNILLDYPIKKWSAIKKFIISDSPSWKYTCIEVQKSPALSIIDPDRSCKHVGNSGQLPILLKPYNRLSVFLRKSRVPSV